jgi:hypothetical protein
MPALCPLQPVLGAAPERPEAEPQRDHAGRRNHGRGECRLECRSYGCLDTYANDWSLTAKVQGQTAAANHENEQMPGCLSPATGVRPLDAELWMPESPWMPDHAPLDGPVQSSQQAFVRVRSRRRYEYRANDQEDRGSRES